MLREAATCPRRVVGSSAEPSGLSMPQLGALSGFLEPPQPAPAALASRRP